MKAPTAIPRGLDQANEVDTYWLGSTFYPSLIRFRSQDFYKRKGQETGIGNLTRSFGANVEEAELQLTKVGSYH